MGVNQKPYGRSTTSAYRFIDKISSVIPMFSRLNRIPDIDMAGTKTGRVQETYNGYIYVFDVGLFRDITCVVRHDLTPK